MPELALGDEHSIEELLDSWVAIEEDLADKVHRPLDLKDAALLLVLDQQSHADGVRGGSGVEEQSLPHGRGG